MPQQVALLPLMVTFVRDVRPDVERPPADVAELPLIVLSRIVVVTAVLIPPPRWPVPVLFVTAVRVSVQGPLVGEDASAAARGVPAHHRLGEAHVAEEALDPAATV